MTFICESHNNNISLRKLLITRYHERKESPKEHSVVIRTKTKYKAIS